MVKQIVDSVREYGEIVKPFLGVRYTMINERIAETNNLPVTYGALVTRGELPDEAAVAPGSPAERAGILEGDIILSIDGEEVRERDVATIVRSKTVGQNSTLIVLSGGEEKTVVVTLDRAL